jgi:prepilin-type N-terminal cleavage/methylation domain-containing protein
MMPSIAHIDHAHARRYARGFSLIEMVLVITLTGIIFAVGAMILRVSFQSYFAGKNRTTSDWQGRLGLERMTRDLHSIASVTVANANDVAFVDNTATAVTYDRDAAASTLRRNGIALANNVTALNFTYFDRTPAATAVAANVYYISVSFTVSVDGVNTVYRATVNPGNFP